MSFEDRIRRALGTSGRGYDPGAPPVDTLTADVARRRRTKRAAAGAGLVVAIVLIVAAALALPGGSTPSRELNAANHPTDPMAFADGRNSTTTSAAPSPTPSTTRAGQGTIAPTGTASSSPATTIRPTPTPTGPVPRTTTTTTGPSTSDTVTVTADDNGKTITLRRGQHLVVSLDAPGWTWSEPDTDNATVLKRTAVSANPSSDHVTASFAALAAGQAHVSASKDAPCRQSNPPCMTPTYLWQVTVNVV